MKAGSQSRHSQIESYGLPVFDSGFMKFEFRISGSIKYWDLVDDSDTGGPSTITVRMEYLFGSQFWYWELCMENRCGGTQKALLCLFLFFGGDLIVGGWGMAGWDRKSYLRPVEITSSSIQDFSRSSKMTHSDMLYYFFEPLLFQIFAPWVFIKT